MLFFCQSFIKIFIAIASRIPNFSKKNYLQFFILPKKMNTDNEDITDCSACAYHKRVNKHIYKENIPQVNKFDPRYSDSYCVDCLFIFDMDFDHDTMDRDDYLKKLFQERMAERSEPFEVWSQKPKILSWYPMNDNATHWRCCTATRNKVVFEDFYTPLHSEPPIKRQETDIISNEKTN